MPSIQDTAYPRLRSHLGARELADIYTPTQEEVELARSVTKGEVSRLGFLVLLKTFQRLGYAVALTEVSPAIIEHVARLSGLSHLNIGLAGYDRSGTRRRHLQVIREHLGVKPYAAAALRSALQAMRDAARTKDEPADLINVAIEELIRGRWELPAFNTLQRAARRVRALVQRTLYRQVSRNLSGGAVLKLNELWQRDAQTQRSTWNEIKQGAGSPTLGHFKDLIQRHTWLSELSTDVRAALVGISVVKLKHFAQEAKSLDAARMQALEPQKRYALAASLLLAQSAQALDDIAEMFIKRMARVHRHGKEALARYHLEQQQRTDELIGTLRELVAAYLTEGSADERLRALDAVLASRSEQVLEQCEAHATYAGNNYYPFLWRYYVSHRATLFRLLRAVSIRSTSQDKSLEEALNFLLENEDRRGDWLSTFGVEDEGTTGAHLIPRWALSWVPDSWWKLITGRPKREPYPERIDRRHYEVCVFSQIMWELKSGDLFLAGSDRFADYREQLVSWEEYEAGIELYGEQVGLPTADPAACVAQAREWLERIARETDATFPQNESVRLEDGEPVIRRSERPPPPEDQRLLESTLAARLEPVHLLDVLVDTEQWLNWTRFFGPLSGHEAKLDGARDRYVTAAFCYGCNLGPTQTARSLKTVDRRQVAWINQRHVTEEKLDQVITELINAYNRFALPKLWGTGQSASADGTKWDLYEQNLLSEYHIRYGGYGGIGYYHVSDKYIALFSRFIPCGAWEAVYLFDGLEQNKSVIQPDTLHGDTQGQRAPVFGLAYLLGVKLMPRIRNWKDLKLFRPRKETRYEHLDELFAESLDWQLIRTHLPDMLRVVLSIKAGRITPSTILRRLGTASRKNRLYFAFRELGRAVRTAFLLTYLGDIELRQVIQAATNKSESFNAFIKWLFFGGEGVIAENDREEQRKIIKYNHVVANCLIFHNVSALARLLHQLAAEGQVFSQAALAEISPYLTAHVNRFGVYTLDMNRQAPPPDYGLGVPGSMSADAESGNGSGV